MTRYIFPGLPKFVREAASEIGKSEMASAASQNSKLSAMANLCAQAGVAKLEHVSAIMAKASEFRDQLRIAARAADLMIEEIERSIGPRQTDPRDLSSVVQQPLPASPTTSKRRIRL